MARALWKENEGWEKKGDRETIYSLNPGPENPETSPWKLVINKTFWFSCACQILNENLYRKTKIQEEGRLFYKGFSYGFTHLNLGMPVKPNITSKV